MADDLLPAEAHALLEAIAGPESKGAWNVIYGGQKFADFSKHPRTFVTIQSGPNKGKKSSAAGKFQITASSYDRVAPKLGITDFSPESQQKIAWQLAQEQYGPSLAADLRSGDPQTLARVARKLAPVWTSLPSGSEAGTSVNRFVANFNAAKAQVPPLPAVTAPEPDDTPPYLAAMRRLPATPGTPQTNFNTVLPPQAEREFQAWKTRYAPNDSGLDYDYRGAFAAGVKPAANGHWPDTFKKPAHDTFSVESQYSKYAPGMAGSWNGETYIPRRVSLEDRDARPRAPVPAAAASFRPLTIEASPDQLSDALETLRQGLKPKPAFSRDDIFNPGGSAVMRPLRREPTQAQLQAIRAVSAPPIMAAARPAHDPVVAEGPTWGQFDDYVNDATAFGARPKANLRGTSVTPRMAIMRSPQKFETGMLGRGMPDWTPASNYNGGATGDDRLPPGEALAIAGAPPENPAVAAIDDIGVLSSPFAGGAYKAKFRPTAYAAPEPSALRVRDNWRLSMMDPTRWPELPPGGPLDLAFTPLSERSAAAMASSLGRPIRTGGGAVVPPSAHPAGPLERRAPTLLDLLMGGGGLAALLGGGNGGVVSQGANGVLNSLTQQSPYWLYATGQGGSNDGNASGVGGGAFSLTH